MTYLAHFCCILVKVDEHIWRFKPIIYKTSHPFKQFVRNKLQPTTWSSRFGATPKNRVTDDVEMIGSSKDGSQFWMISHRG